MSSRRTATAPSTRSLGAPSRRTSIRWRPGGRCSPSRAEPAPPSAGAGPAAAHWGPRHVAHARDRGDRRGDRAAHSLEPRVAGDGGPPDLGARDWRYHRARPDRRPAGTRPAESASDCRPGRPGPVESRQRALARAADDRRGPGRRPPRAVHAHHRGDSPQPGDPGGLSPAHGGGAPQEGRHHCGHAQVPHAPQRMLRARRPWQPA